MPESLSPRDGAALLQLARAAIVDAVRGGATVDDLLARLDIGPALREPRGVFVTLRAAPTAEGQAELRGCIGTMGAVRPLFENVVKMAPRSALDDPRFPPLTADELDGISIEVSALTPLRPVASVGEITVGRHGVQLFGQGRHSVFLPQVAVQQGWSATEFLEHLALKAGLSRDAWREADLRVFEAEIFEEARTADQEPRGGSNTR